MLNRKTKKKLDSLINEMNVNLENNYKDLAHDALKELDRQVTEMAASGELKGEYYERYRNLVDDTKRRLANYHH